MKKVIQEEIEGCGHFARLWVGQQGHLTLNCVGLGCRNNSALVVNMWANVPNPQRPQEVWIQKEKKGTRWHKDLVEARGRNQWLRGNYPGTKWFRAISARGSSKNHGKCPEGKYFTLYHSPVLLASLKGETQLTLSKDNVLSWMYAWLKVQEVVHRLEEENIIMQKDIPQEKYNVTF